MAMGHHQVKHTLHNYGNIVTCISDHDYVANVVSILKKPESKHLQTHRPNASPSSSGIILNNHTSSQQSLLQVLKWQRYCRRKVQPSEPHGPGRRRWLTSRKPTYILQGPRSARNSVASHMSRISNRRIRRQRRPRDISLEQACDGAATISATNGSGQCNELTNDVLSGAPPAAIQNKPDGRFVLATTVGNRMSGPIQATMGWETRSWVSRRPVSEEIGGNQM